MARKPAQATEPEPPKRERSAPDEFQQARSIYKRRRTHLVKAHALLLDTSKRVRSLVETLEAADKEAREVELQEERDVAASLATLPLDDDEAAAE